MSNYFEGWYLKHQKGNNTIAFIPGISNEFAFVQAITNNISYNIQYPLSEYRIGESIKIGKNIFSKKGCLINLKSEDIDIYGEIKYSCLTPIKYDIMGVFKYFPMECRHGIVSMHHGLDGSVNINGKITDFTNGIGYIEKDSGTSFPETYLWIHCNDFKEKCSIMVSIADIPFLCLKFKGCICIVYYKGKEYRLATYLGVKIEHHSDKNIKLNQGKYHLEIDIYQNSGNRLYAPDKGNMTRIIKENVSCKARFRFFIKDMLLFESESDNTSFEFVH